MDGYEGYELMECARDEESLGLKLIFKVIRELYFWKIVRSIIDTDSSNDLLLLTSSDRRNILGLNLYI